MRRGTLGLVLAVASTVVFSGVAHASPSSPAIRADVEGRSILRSEISAYFCHDFDFPRIHCFSTAAGLEAVTTTTSTETSVVAAAFGPNDYVTVYSGPTFSGTYAHLSRNYDTLFYVGWNDQISSYKGRNNASGTFWSDWYATGRATNFCCNTQVTSLPSGVDNTFTSVYRH